MSPNVTVAVTRESRRFARQTANVVADDGVLDAAVGGAEDEGVPVVLDLVPVRRRVLPRAVERLHCPSCTGWSKSFVTFATFDGPRTKLVKAGAIVSARAKSTGRPILVEPR